MYYTTSAKNILLGGLTINRLSLHTGNPGADGTANEYAGDGYSRQNATFAAAEDGKRKLSTAVVFGGEPSDSVSWLGFWSTGTFRGAVALAAGGANTFDASTGLLAILADDTYYGIDEC